MKDKDYDCPSCKSKFKAKIFEGVTSVYCPYCGQKITA